ncbi:MAG: class E sortase [Acidimicrobiales bacterium]
MSAVCLLAAVGLLGYPFFTGLYEGSIQGSLSKQLNSPATRQAYLHHAVPVGDSLTRIKIPKIGLSVVVVEGTTASALRTGAGHYPNTPLPCTLGNVAIAGHRTTYGKPFSNVGELRPGDVIEFDTPIGSCTYTVSQKPFRVLPNDTSVVANTPGLATLTLTSCAPKGSATHRIIIKATMNGFPTGT